MDKYLSKYKATIEEYLFKYQVTVYHESDGDEHIYRGVVFAHSFAHATEKVVEAFEFKGTSTSAYDSIICDITIKEYLDEAGDHTDIYVFEEGEN
jgi:hypothetical protein